ncbi:TlpA family protein disulfide reductase [Streptomyces longispororuber]|uniref:TlpA family protein disulfide reductase n=1 Tax=Streptomyces longispororuber TaxID=68230 RepID=UPI00210877E1|nr:thioredoxin family protein [Streptomyces longispororuber]MCQ4206042.1 thioredoxin family protein [Streptomyces longispororuber]
MTVGEVALDAEQLGEELGERATLVQFSSAFCAPCRATRRVLDEVAAMVPGVSHVEIDAEARLDLVREVGVLKTPTVLVLDARGREVRRAAGQPRKIDVIAALGEAV